MTIKLTPKQEGFCLSYIETGNASEAYRLNYGVEKMKPESVNRMAAELLNNLKITSRLAELQKGHQERHNITIDSLTDRYNKAETFAYSRGNPAAVVSSITALARLHGLIVDKKQIGGDPDNYMPVTINVNVVD